MNLPRVSILLATYAGERYLPEQLDSLARQRAVDWRLLWRDDGSPDESVNVMERFAASQPGRVVRVIEPSGRIGAARGFLALLAAASDEPGVLHAFCDQDDVWLPDKLSRAAAAIGNHPPEVPVLYCARQRLVGPDLAPRGLSALPRHQPGFANALVQNIATGCTVVLNAAARRLVLSVPAPLSAGSMHDWWCYLLVTGCGGRFAFDPEPVVLYRQHGTNAIGATAALPLRALGALRRGANAFLATLAGHLHALEAAPLTPQARATVAMLRDGLRERGARRRLARLREAGLYRQGLSEGLLLRLWVALHPLPPVCSR